MASVGLSTVWLNLASDLAQSLSFEFVTGIDPSPSTPGEDRQYGAGRFRAVLSGSTQKQAKVTAQAVTADQVATLREWDGLLVCYRDDSGLKFYGTYRSPQISRHQYNPDSDVSLTITETTVSEVV
jgi:hypothetical protein